MSDRLALIDSLLGDEEGYALHPDEFTSEMYWERAKEKGLLISRITIRGKLCDLVKDGILQMRKTPINGKSVNVYRPNKEVCHGTNNQKRKRQ